MMTNRRRFVFAAMLFLAASVRPVGATEFGQAFRRAAAGPWKNPLPAADADGRRFPDVRRALRSGRLAVFCSEYFPGWVVAARSKRLVLFHRLPQVWRVGGPTRLALSSPGGVRVFDAGGDIPAAALAAMDKPWMLVWFAGARNWQRFDMPVVVVLQRRPSAAALRGNLDLRFAGEAGVVVMLNLYGYYKPPQDNSASRRWADAKDAAKSAAFGLRLGPTAPVNVRPYEWKRTLPPHVIERCDFFSRLARAVPTHLRDSFQVDLAKSTLRIRYKVGYLQTRDDWGTKAKKLAPVSPALALAARYGLPVLFDGELFDPVYPTTTGPWTGIADADEYVASLAYLHCLTETYVAELNRTSGDEIVRAAIRRLTEQAPAAAMGRTYKAEDQKRKNFCWGSITHDRQYAIGMHYVQPPKLARARENLRRLFRYSYFTEAGYKQGEIGGRTFLYRTDAGIGGGPADDAGKLVMDLFLTGWLYAYHARDYGWVPPKAGVMEKLCAPLALMAWARGGRGGIAEMGDEAAPALSYARLQYIARDQSRFAWGAYLAAMELLKLFNKCGPMGDYARHFQPWGRFEEMDDTENATDCAGGAYGWNIGGPGHEPIAPGMRSGVDVAPYRRHGSAQWVSRWRCMADFDVDRFFREHCADTPGGLREEFDTWLRRDFADLGPRATYPARNDAFRNPCKLLGLRMQLLGETPDQIRKRLGGWPISWNHVWKANWNGEPAPWIYWALAPRKRYERILAAEELGWTPGLGSRYPVQHSDLVYAGGHLGRRDEVSGEPYPPFPWVARWEPPGAPKGSDWGLGFVSADVEHKISSVTLDGGVAAFAWSNSPVEPDPLEVPLEGRWRFALDPDARGIRQGWYRPGFDDAQWKRIRVPGLWEHNGYGNREPTGPMPKGVFPPEIKANKPPNYAWPYDGTAWYRIQVTVPAAFRGRRVFFHAGMIDDFDIVWFNGVKIGRTDAGTTKTWWLDTRLYPVPTAALKIGGENVIAVMVCDNNWGGGIVKGPVRLIAKRRAPNPRKTRETGARDGKETTK